MVVQFGPNGRYLIFDHPGQDGGVGKRCGLSSAGYGVMGHNDFSGTKRWWFTIHNWIPLINCPPHPYPLHHRCISVVLLRRFTLSGYLFSVTPSFINFLLSVFISLCPMNQVSLDIYSHVLLAFERCLKSKRAPIQIYSHCTWQINSTVIMFSSYYLLY